MNANFSKPETCLRRPGRQVYKDEGYKLMGTNGNESRCQAVSESDPPDGWEISNLDLSLSLTYHLKHL